MKYLYLSALMIASTGCANESYYINEGKKEPLTFIQTKERSNSNLDMYKTKNGIKVGVSDSLLVKFYDTKNLELYIKKYNILHVKKVLPNLYEFKVMDKSLTLDVANELSVQKDVKYAHPNFVKKVRKR